MEVRQNKIISIPTSLYRWVLGTMVVLFMVYNFWVYTSSAQIPIPKMSEKAIHGQVLWQKYNCASCHQLYGLGGYLGPDLTNIVSKPGKGPDYVGAFLNSGVKAMPKFSFTEKEKDEIIAYLTHVDNTGYFPNKESELHISGWTKLKYKSSNSLNNE